MSLELNLRFPDPAHVIVSLDGETTEALPFMAPLRREDHEELRWYLETYAARYTTEVDDQRAARLVQRLPAWGQALFDAVWHDRAAQRLLNAFQDSQESGRLLTISAEHPSILALPWELLHDSASGGTFFVHESPRLSIRRRMPGATGGRRPARVQTKAQLHLLFVISRPTDAPFIDPRADAQAVLDAVEAQAPGAVVVEFLRPATLDGLVKRLEDEALPPVDIVHFDGHGVFDRDGRVPAEQTRQGARSAPEAGLLRAADLQHPDYPTANSRRHRVLLLAGLDEEEALRYFQALYELPPVPTTSPPAREGLLTLFRLVDFHPLSIGLLAQQLKTLRVAELGERLQVLLAETPDNPLLASLNLSLERVEATAQAWLPRLGVLQGGAFEDNLLEITDIPETAWAAMRPGLVAAALIQPESVPGVPVPYLKFHPTLAPALWERLTLAQQVDLSARHRQRYYEVSGFLYDEDTRHPHEVRAMARRELPNLLHAVHAALQAGEEWAVDLVKNVNLFLGVFGLHRDRTVLTQRAQAGGTQTGSHAWFLARCNQGEQLFGAGQYGAAEAVFREVLSGVREAPSHECGFTLLWLGRCVREQGHPEQAVSYVRRALLVLEQVQASAAVQQLQSAGQTELGDALAALGNYDAAQAAYEASLALASGDKQQAVVAGRFGALAQRRGDLPAAAARYREALHTFQQLSEPESEASAWHQLGLVYQEGGQWEEADTAYREAARLCEVHGLLFGVTGAAHTWQQLAQVSALRGYPVEAEAW